MHSQVIFQDRHDAGHLLAEALRGYVDQPDVLVLALPRGGVPVAWEISHDLNIPFEVILVRKLGVPGNEEMAMGAIAEGGVILFNEHLIKNFNISQSQQNHVLAQELNELHRRCFLYRQGRAFPDITNKTTILVDDGIATGFTMVAALKAVKKLNPKTIIIAVPVGSCEAISVLKSQVDQIICLREPHPFKGVGEWYVHFDQLKDTDVIEYLTKP